MTGSANCLHNELCELLSTNTSAAVAATEKDNWCQALLTVLRVTHDGVGFALQTMGGDFSSRGKQDCSKGIYVLAGSASL